MTDWLLANPKAGDGERNGDFWTACLAQAGVCGLKACALDDQGENPEWIASVAPEDRLLAAGGDGSVNAAARICLETGATLAVLPSGTANDFFRNLGIENSPETIAGAVAQGHTQRADVAEYQVEQQLATHSGIFLNVAHVGLGTMPARDANSNGRAKQRFGRLTYSLSLLRRILTRQGFRATIHTEQAMLSGRWLSIAVANGRYFGGGSEIPGAGVDTGVLVVLAIRPASIIGLTTAFVLTRLLGRAPKDSGTVVEVLSPWCRISTRQPKTVTVDGDVVGKTPFRATCQAGKLKVVSAPAAGAG